MCRLKFRVPDQSTLYTKATYLDLHSAPEQTACLAQSYAKNMGHFMVNMLEPSALKVVAPGGTYPDGVVLYQNWKFQNHNLNPSQRYLIYCICTCFKEKKPDFKFVLTRIFEVNLLWLEFIQVLESQANLIMSYKFSNTFEFFSLTLIFDLRINKRESKWVRPADFDLVIKKKRNRKKKEKEKKDATATASASPVAKTIEKKKREEEDKLKKEEDERFREGHHRRPKVVDVDEWDAMSWDDIDLQLPSITVFADEGKATEPKPITKGKTKESQSIKKSQQYVVDKGLMSKKTKAGGITQQISATYIPTENIRERTKDLKAGAKIDVAGLLVIDTPGHESFNNLMSRCSILCDVAILVVDITNGLQPQTIESIKLLKMKNTDVIENDKPSVVVALNKVDRLYGWKSVHRGERLDVAQKERMHLLETAMFNRRKGEDILGTNDEDWLFKE
ncbi:eukaryotic translation initiation factor 5B-like protein [Tanacetum coccineum]